MGDEQPVFNAPWSVVAFLALILGIHGLSVALPSIFDIRTHYALGFVPARYAIEVAGGWPGGRVADFTSVVTYQLLHGDWLHVLLNSAWLLAFGTPIARRGGHMGFLVVMLLSGICGALLFALIHPAANKLLIGASGGVSGLMGAVFRFMFSEGPGGFARLRENPGALPLMGLWTALRTPQVQFVVGVWILINLVFGVFGEALTGGAAIAWEAHLGGFLFGFLCYGVFDRQPRAA